MTTKQATPAKDMNRNPNGKGGFQDRPEDRHSGAWKKEDTARFKLERMMELSETELELVIADDTKPMFEHKLAQAIRDGKWTVIKEMMQEVYGKPKESVDLSNPDKSLNPFNALTTAELRKLAGK